MTFFSFSAKWPSLSRSAGVNKNDVPHCANKAMSADRDSNSLSVRSIWPQMTNITKITTTIKTMTTITINTTEINPVHSAHTMYERDHAFLCVIVRCRALFPVSACFTSGRARVSFLALSRWPRLSRWSLTRFCAWSCVAARYSPCLHASLEAVGEFLALPRWPPPRLSVTTRCVTLVEAAVWWALRSTASLCWVSVYVAFNRKKEPSQWIECMC